MIISLIVPVYNVEDYLEQTIKSVVEQEGFEKVELILINDGSRDSSAVICKEYESRYENVVFLDKHNEGVSQTRNIGIDMAKGQYIMLLDSDDFLTEGTLMPLIEKLESDNIDLLITNYHFYDEDSKKRSINSEELDESKVKGKNGREVLEYILSTFPLFNWYPWRIVVRKALLVDNEIYFLKGRNFEDMTWTPLVYLVAQKVDYFSLPLINYRLNREGQITGDISYKNLADQIFVPSYMEEKLDEEKYGVTDELKNKIMRNLSNKYFLIPIYANRLNKSERYEILRLMKSHDMVNKYKYTKLSKIVSVMTRNLGYANTSRVASIVLKIAKKGTK